MALPVGTVIEITAIGQLFGQTTMNVWHYVVNTQSTTLNDQLELEDLLAQHWNAGPGTISLDFINCCPTNWTMTRMTAQAIHPERKRRVTELRGHTGDTGVATSANLQSSVTLVTDRAGRDQIGGKRIPMAADQSLAGNLTPAYKTLVTAFALSCLDRLIVSIGGGQYDPVIYHRNTAVFPRYALVTDSFAQDTTRVMRRRTVGLGI